MPIGDLPPKLLELILSFVIADQIATSTNIASLRLVCKYWLPYLTVVFFSTIHFDHVTGRRFLDLISHSPYIAHVVRDLTIVCSCPRILDGQLRSGAPLCTMALLLPTLAGRLPNVRVLRIHGLRGHPFYTGMMDHFVENYASATHLSLEDCAFVDVRQLGELLASFPRLACLRIGAVTCGAPNLAGRTGWESAIGTLDLGGIDALAVRVDPETDPGLIPALVAAGKRLLRLDFDWSYWSTNEIVEASPVKYNVFIQQIDLTALHSLRIIIFHQAEGRYDQSNDMLGIMLSTIFVSSMKMPELERAHKMLTPSFSGTHDGRFSYWPAFVTKTPARWSGVRLL